MQYLHGFIKLKTFEVKFDSKKNFTDLIRIIESFQTKTFPPEI